MITETDSSPRQDVSITGIHVPFWSVVGFMVKWSIAAIPALIILTVIIIAVDAVVVVFIVHVAALGSFTALLRELLTPPTQ